MGNCMDSKDNDEKYTFQNRPVYYQNSQLCQKDQVIIRLKDLRDELYSKQQALFRQEEKSEIEIRTLLRNCKKQRAKFALQRKKLYDNYLMQIEQRYNIITRYILQIEVMIFDESLNEVMKSTNKFLKDIQNTINIDVFSDAMAGHRAIEEQEEQFEQLFEKYNVGDVDKEFARYEAEMFQNQISQSQFQHVQIMPNQSQQIYMQQQMPIQQKYTVFN